MNRFEHALLVGAVACGLAGAAQVGDARDRFAQDRALQSQDQAPQSQALQHQVPQPHAAQGNISPDQNKGLSIWPPGLAATHPQEPYVGGVTVQGDYVPTLHCRVESGALPPGIQLADNGELRGAAERAGDFQFVVAVWDGAQPPHVLRKEFVIKVVEALTLKWRVPAHVTANRIDGSVEVSNTTKEDMDLTFDVKAVAENGRATEIGYQHFLLKNQTAEMVLPFGDTLPHGAYKVYINAVGEVAKRNVIYKQQLKTPSALQVVVGP